MSDKRTGNRGTGFFDVLDGAETALYGIGGAVVLGLVILKGTLAAADVAGPAAAAAVLAGCVLVAGAVARDVRRRRWSVLSVALAAAWAITVFALVVASSLPAQ